MLDLNQSSILFINDHVNKINGMTVFSHFFLNHIKKQYNSNIVMISLSEIVTFENSDLIFDFIILNGYNSIADKYHQKGMLLYKLKDFNIKISPYYKLGIVSHGWLKLNNRYTFYNLFYYLKNISNNICVEKRLGSYNFIIFISDKINDFRHRDRKLVEFMSHSFIDLDLRESYINHFKENIQGGAKIFLGNYILIISNFDPIKNLFVLPRILLKKNFFNRRKKIEFIVLTQKSNSIYSRIVLYISKLLGVRFEHDQSKKKDLISGCKYLFIPSYSEYLPLVALEAMSFRKYVISLYKIESLTDMINYKYLKL